MRAYLYSRSARCCRIGMLVLLSACTASNDGSTPANVVGDAVPLASAIDSISERFTVLADLVEINDSLAIVIDVSERSVWQVNFASASRAPFGRTGDGPGEYRFPAAILRLGGDTIVIASAGPNPRLALVSTRGEPLGTHTLDLPRVMSSPSTFDEWPPQPTAYDGRGNLYGVRPRTPVGFDPLPPEQEREVLVRFNLSRSRFDTIAEVRPTNAYRARLVAGELEYDLPLGPFDASDAWGVISDGTVMLVDEATYSLTMHAERGTVSAPRVVAHSTRPLVPAAWTQYVDSARSALLDLFNSGPSMVGALTASQVRVPDAPTSFPPVAADRTRRMLHDGTMLWIPVNRSVANAHEQWDVIRSDGTVFARYELPPNARLVAVTTQYLYAVQTSDDELQQLTRARRADGAGAANR